MSEQPRHEDWCPCSQLIGAPMDEGERGDMGAFAWPPDACVCGAVPVAPPLPAGPVFEPGGRCPCGADVRYASGIGPYCTRTGYDGPCDVTAGPVAPPSENWADDAKWLRLYNLVSSLAHPRGDHRENALEDEAHDIIRELSRSLTRPVLGEAPRGAARPPQPAKVFATDEEVRVAANRMLEKHRPSLERLAKHDGPPASPPALEAWHPIETAPHDNKRRLFRLASGWVTFGAWTNYYGGRFLMESGKYSEPTHWCDEPEPLAVPPEAPPP